MKILLRKSALDLRGNIPSYSLTVRDKEGLDKPFTSLAFNHSTDFEFVEKSLFQILEFVTVF